MTDFSGEKWYSLKNRSVHEQSIAVASRGSSPAPLAPPESTSAITISWRRSSWRSCWAVYSSGVIVLSAGWSRLVSCAASLAWYTFSAGRKSGPGRRRVDPMSRTASAVSSVLSPSWRAMDGSHCERSGDSNLATFCMMASMGGAPARGRREEGAVGR